MVHDAKYWTNRFEVGLVYAGKDFDGDDEWIGTAQQFRKLKVAEFEQEFMHYE